MFNLIISSVLVTISGSRSSLLVIVFISFISVVVVLLEKENRLIKKIIIWILTTILLVTIFFSTNYLSTRNSLFRSMPSLEALYTALLEERDSSQIFNSEIKVTDPFTVQNQDVNIEYIESEKEISNNIRSELWNASIEQIKKSPITGTGIISFPVRYGNIVTNQGSHNFILEIWLIFWSSRSFNLFLNDVYPNNQNN